MQQVAEKTVVAGLALDPMLPRLYRVQRMRRETGDTFTLELVPAEGSADSRFTPGQFNMLYIFGAGEVPVSISGDPKTSPLIQHTTRVVGPVTRQMLQLKRGDMVGVRGPFGHPWPLQEAAGRDLVIVAGGIGLAPLRPVLYHALAERRQYRKVILLYGARTPEDILYRSELRLWRSKPDLGIHVTVNYASSGWRGNVGVVTKLIARAPFDPSNAAALLCGPEVMMRFAAMELQRRGLKAEHIYLAMERNMKCAVGFCGRCQYGPLFVCKDGPVFRLDRIACIFGKPEI